MSTPEHTIKETSSDHQGHGEDLIAVAASHRKIANPLPSGAYGFGTTMLLFSLYTLHVAQIELSNGLLTMSLTFGGLAQFFAGIWEFASGNTFGATLFICYSAFWWGYSIILIPFFGLTGIYDGQPNVYSPQGMGAAEASEAIGLFLWIWFGITTLFLLSSSRTNAATIAFLVCLDLTLALLAAYGYTGNASLEKAGGALGVVTAFILYYIGTAALLTKNTSYFNLPVGKL